MCLRQALRIFFVFLVVWPVEQQFSVSLHSFFRDQYALLPFSFGFQAQDVTPARHHWTTVIHKLQLDTYFRIAAGMQATKLYQPPTTL